LVVLLLSRNNHSVCVRLDEGIVAISGNSRRSAKSQGIQLYDIETGKLVCSMPLQFDNICLLGDAKCVTSGYIGYSFHTMLWNFAPTSHGLSKSKLQTIEKLLLSTAEAPRGAVKEIVTNIARLVEKGESFKVLRQVSKLALEFALEYPKAAVEKIVLVRLMDQLPKCMDVTKSFFGRQVNFGYDNTSDFKGLFSSQLVKKCASTNQDILRKVSTLVSMLYDERWLHEQSMRACVDVLCKNKKGKPVLQRILQLCGEILDAQLHLTYVSLMGFVKNH